MIHTVLCILVLVRFKDIIMKPKLKELSFYNELRYLIVTSQYNIGVQHLDMLIFLPLE